MFIVHYFLNLQHHYITPTMIKKLTKAVAAALVLLTASCGKTPDSNTIVVSVEPQQTMLEEIVGDRFDIVTMLTPGANPETFEPGMQARRQLETAQAYFTTGHLPFEHRLEEAAGGKVRIVDTSNGITPVYGTHEHSHGENHEGHHHHEGEGADPHVWTSVKNARIMARNMYDAAVELQPESKDFFTVRYEALDHRLDSLDKAFAARLGASSNPKSFAIWHPSLSYLARDYSLNQVAVGFENKEMPASTLRDVIGKARDAGVKVFFFQKEFDSRQAESLNSEMGTTLITINPLDHDWEQQLDSIVSALCR